jgi:chromosome segregation ATPase
MRTSQTIIQTLLERMAVLEQFHSFLHQIPTLENYQEQLEKLEGYRSQLAGFEQIEAEAAQKLETMKTLHDSISAKDLEMEKKRNELTMIRQELERTQQELKRIERLKSQMHRRAKAVEGLEGTFDEIQQELEKVNSDDETDFQRIQQKWTDLKSDLEAYRARKEADRHRCTIA